MRRSGGSKWILLFGSRLNASGGYEAAVTSRVRIGWVRFREYRELLIGKGFC